MRERLEALRDGWTTPHVFPWDELIEIIVGLDARVTALEPKPKAEATPK
jgi:hypothetical protein